MKFLLDFSPALLFFAAYFRFGIYTATAVLIVALFAVVAAYWLWRRELHKGHLVTAVMAAVLGGLTIYVHNPAFIMFKPTAVYAVFALALLGSHFFGRQVLMARIGGHVLTLPDPVWRKVNFAWAAYFAFCAGLNLYIAARFSQAVWVEFKTFGFTAMSFVFLIAHVPFLSGHLKEGNAVRDSGS